MSLDGHGRRVDYLRVSVTDRCNLRCVYCMPAEGIAWKPPSEVLTYEEIERFAGAALAEGVSKVRITGGEPLVRRGVVGLVRRLREVVGVESVALTTNGVLLPRFAGQLRAAGLVRVNVSLDTLDETRYAEMTRGGRLADALAGIEAALEAGMGPLKINVVVVRRFEQDLMAFARMSVDRPLHVRFIEYMPVGGDRAEGPCGVSEGAWSEADHVPADEALSRLTEAAALEGLGAPAPVPRSEAPGGWGPARYLRFPGAAGTIGLISPLTHHFCDDCDRLRLTADGRLRTCLFSDDELDVRLALRHGTDDDVRALVRAAMAAKPAGHGMRRGTGRRMSEIGG